MNQSIGIIKFAPLQRDARVLRQIKYLSNHYHLTVLGYGPAHPTWQDHPQVTWLSVPEARGFLPIRIIRLLLLILGRLFPFCYDGWYWSKTPHKFALAQAQARPCDALLANDWEALPVAVEAAKITGAKVVLDALEYAPLEFEGVWFWRLLHGPMIRYFLHKYDTQVDRSITVAPAIAEKYRQVFQLKPIVILNTPDPIALPPKTVDPARIRMIHHGVANRDRRLERMIETIARCDSRYSLDFMLVQNDPDYIQALKKLAAAVAPGRITFREPVPYGEIVPAIATYDMGFYLLDPNSYNNQVALPNKFFDFIMAGLAVCIGPSPSMAEIVRRYGFGCVAPSFEPDAVATMLNQLRDTQLVEMQQAARRAAERFNADQEMGKLVDLFHQIFSGSDSISPAEPNRVIVTNDG